MGNGEDCAVDTDGDGYPNTVLPSCTKSNNKTYCFEVRVFIRRKSICYIHEYIYTGYVSFNILFGKHCLSVQV